MKAIKVNADYESVLFHNKPLLAINEAIEFLALYLEERPLHTTKKYSEEFISHVQDLTGRRPQFKKEGPFENWWGPLKDLELERKLNSKKMSAELNIQEGWAKGMQLISNLTELKPLHLEKSYLAKELFGMSGRNIHRFQGNNLERLQEILTGKEILIEPLLDRKWDFSHYIFPDGKMICYENTVDDYFQYKGTTFKDISHPTLENLSFYSKVSKDKWTAFQESLSKIISTYQHPELPTGFSIDSFIYEEEGEFHIQHLSEVNYRKTMGYVAYELGKKLGRGSGQVSMQLRKEPNEKKESEIILSPEKSRFEIVLDMRIC